MTPTETSLAGRTAIVTGAGSRAAGIGIGRASAIVLARHGARVLLVDLDGDNVEQTRRMVEAEGGDAITAVADVGDASACNALAARVLEQWGRIDIVLNNVGIAGPPGTAEALDVVEWEKAMHINVTSMMLMVRSCVPHMNAGGSIINMASIAGLYGSFANLLYPTSKRAVVNMTRVMAVHYGGRGIRVNCIAPGLVYTPMVAGRMDQAKRRQRIESTLLQTEGTGWDVAHAVAWLAGDAARWVTGIVLPVDGGAMAGQPLKG